MICSLNCFCDFFQAKSRSARTSVIRRYKNASTEESKGRISYYGPAKRALMGKLCPSGTFDEKLDAIRQACIRSSWTDKLNDARIANNARVFRVCRSVFGNDELVAESNPRLQFLASTDVAINLQSDLLYEIDGELNLVVLGLKKRQWPRDLIRHVIQMFYCAAKHKGLPISIDRILYLETGTGQIHREDSPNLALRDGLKQLVEELSKEWES